MAAVKPYWLADPGDGTLVKWAPEWAQEDQLTPGNWLAPPDAIYVEPPAPKAYQTPVWTGERWKNVIDFRSLQFYKKDDGSQVRLVLGESIDQNLTVLRKPHEHAVWAGTCWETPTL